MTAILYLRLQALSSRMHWESVTWPGTSLNGAMTIMPSIRNRLRKKRKTPQARVKASTGLFGAQAINMGASALSGPPIGITAMPGGKTLGSASAGTPTSSPRKNEDGVKKGSFSWHF